MTLKIGFPGAKTVHPGEGQGLPWGRVGPSRPSCTLAIQGSEEAVARLPWWPPGRLSKASTQPISSPNACSVPGPDRSVVDRAPDHWALQPAVTPLAGICPSLPGRTLRLPTCPSSPSQLTVLNPGVFSFMIPLYSGPAKKKGVGTLDITKPKWDSLESLACFPYGPRGVPRAMGLRAGEELSLSKATLPIPTPQKGHCRRKPNLLHPSVFRAGEETRDEEGQQGTF